MDTRAADFTSVRPQLASQRRLPEGRRHRVDLRQRRGRNHVVHKQISLISGYRPSAIARA